MSKHGCNGVHGRSWSSAHSVLRLCFAFACTGVGALRLVLDCSLFDTPTVGWPCPRGGASSKSQYEHEKRLPVWAVATHERTQGGVASLHDACGLGEEQAQQVSNPITRQRLRLRLRCVAPIARISMQTADAPVLSRVAIIQGRLAYPTCGFARTHAHTHAHARTRTHARTHARTAQRPT